MRTATARDIDRRIRSAGDHLGALIQHEKGIAEATESGETELEARRRFERDLLAFFAAARTARNYLIQKATASGRRDWLDGRLAPALFEFHAAVANQDLHDHPVTVTKTYNFEGTGTIDVVRLVDGGAPMLIPRPSRPVRFTEMRLTYVDSALEQGARRAHDIIKDGPRGQRGVIQLAGDYIEGLRAIVRDAEHEGLFDDADQSPMSSEET